MPMSRTHTTIAAAVMIMVAAATVVTFVRDDGTTASALPVRSQTDPPGIVSEDQAIPELVDTTPEPDPAVSPDTAAAVPKPASKTSDSPPTPSATHPDTTPTTSRPAPPATNPPTADPEPSHAPSPSPEPPQGLIEQILGGLLGG